MSTTAPPHGRGAARVTARLVAEAADHLAAPSPVVAGVLELLDAGAPSARRLAARVGQSPELAAQVLRLANSAHFGEGADTLEAALVRLGDRTLRALLLSAATYRLLEGAMPAYGAPRLALLRHCDDVATMAAALVRQAPGALATHAHLAGLLHDLGKPILARVAEELGVVADGLASVADEREAFGTDHTRVGAWIARRWGLPDELCASMEHHHDAAPPDDPVARAVWLADVAVHAAAGDEAAIASLPASAAACGLGSDALEALLIASPESEPLRRPPGLTDREVEVLRLLGRGAAAKQVARELGCSPSTVHNHLHHVYRKLGVSGQSQALLLARERRWI
ncbi:HDOD domain-containing protein [Miltoncostaea marina]|uniref:HDOD domain-containing protein n=1 Tax=Miltoncostaea marina TaxID=2843215 RepID=UPI001C3D2265|nr:HDOD domain-containing protein [Miltoncostaea marina]